MRTTKKTRTRRKTAEDEDDEEDDKVSKTAMDSAIRLAADSATKKAAENFRKIREAEQVVRPLIGDVVAMDSAEDVYRTALEQSGVDNLRRSPVRLSGDGQNGDQPERKFTP